MDFGYAVYICALFGQEIISIILLHLSDPTGAEHDLISL
jgi:hypothetical protein